MHTPKNRVIILGGGISGLMAAWHLGRAGFGIEVWEASDVPGGWAQTMPWPGPNGEPGFLERGPQSLRISRGGALDRLVGGLDLKVHPVGPRGPRWLGKDGGRHPGPTTFAGLMKAPGLTFGALVRMLAEPLIPPSGISDESLHAFFSRRLGEGFARELLPALVAGVLAAPPERIGLEALPRLREREARGGLFLGGLRMGLERTGLLEGGVGALAQTLAARIGSVILHRRAQALEPLEGGRWRVHGVTAAQEAEAHEAETVVLALPPRAASGLLKPLAPAAARLLEAIPCLDLRLWHSRHPMVPGWERGFGLLIHPPEGRGLLGAVSLAAKDPRGVPGLLQVRTYLGGAYALAPELDTWPSVLRELRRWLPELPDPIQVREESCPGAFPLMEPGHGTRVDRLLAELPPNLHWIGAARFGPGLPDLAEGIDTWARRKHEGCATDAHRSKNDLDRSSSVFIGG